MKINLQMSRLDCWPNYTNFPAIFLCRRPPSSPTENSKRSQKKRRKVFHHVELCPNTLFGACISIQNVSHSRESFNGGWRALIELNGGVNCFFSFFVIVERWALTKDQLKLEHKTLFYRRPSFSPSSPSSTLRLLFRDNDEARSVRKAADGWLTFK